MGARRAKIVATLGPSTDGLEGDLVAAGLDVARLNFSHGRPEDHARRAAAVRAAAAATGRVVALLQDLQGPKIRVGRLASGGPVCPEAGNEVRITIRDVEGTAALISSTYDGLPGDVRPGDVLLLDDGRLRLRARETTAEEVVAEVEEGGLLGEHKGINLPGVAVSAPALTEKDRADLRYGVQTLGVDYVALSFVRSAAEVQAVRVLLREMGAATPLIAKLEKGEAIADLDAVLAAADGVMVARGDLGVELGPERVPALQKTIIARANGRGIPVITATQMLESMVQGEAPTRAEASDVANAVWDGSDAVMLSAETAVGRHPLLVLRMMERIIREAEAATLPAPPRGSPTPLCGAAAHGADWRGRPQGWPAGRPHTPELRRKGYAAAVTHAACVLADDVGASAIVGFTRSGRTAQLLSGGRPGVPVYAFSPDEGVCRRLALWWGVTPVPREMAGGLEGNIAVMESYLKRHCGATAGQTVVIVGSHPFQKRMHTNFVKYQVLRPDGEAAASPEQIAPVHDA